MHPVFVLFGHAVQSYYFCAAAAGTVGVLLSLFTMRREKLGVWRILLPLLMVIAAVFGARLLNFCTNPEAYGSNFSVFTPSYTQLSLMGGLISGTAFIFAFCAMSKRSPVRLLDCLSLPSAAGIMLLKLGCFLNGCCFGTPTDGVFGMVFPANARKYEFLESLHLPVTSPRVHPTQLYELFGAAAAIILAYSLEKALNLRPGSRFSIFASVFTLARLLVLPLRVLPYPEAVTSVFYPCLYCLTIAICTLYLLISNLRQKPPSSENSASV